MEPYAGLLILVLILGARSGLGQLSPMNQSASLYDVQIGETFGVNLTGLAVNVKAVAQADPSGYGPCYLLNGLTSSGWWYQVGLSYNWPDSSGHLQGYNMNYEVFAPNGSSVYPRSGGGITQFNGPVKAGDQISLSISTDSGYAYMEAVDTNTGARAVEAFPMFGSYFVGLTNSSSNPNGYFTGVMTEWYHQVLNLSEVQQVYALPLSLNSAIVWLSLRGPGRLSYARAVNFSSSTPYLLQGFSFQGAQAWANGSEFLTGNGVNASIQSSEAVTDAGRQNFVISVNATGGAPPYVFILYENSTRVGEVSSNLPYAEFRANIFLNASAYLYAIARSAEGIGGSPAFDLVVNPDPRLSVSGALVYDVGQSPSLNVSVQGGTPPYSYLFLINGTPEPPKAPLSRAGKASLEVVADDSAGDSASSSLQITVNSDPRVKYYFSSNATDVGIPVRIEATAQGGTPPYAYYWYVNGTPLSASSLTEFLAGKPGVYEVRSEVVDSAGCSVEGPLTPIEVNRDPNASYSVTLLSSVFLKDIGFKAKVNATGGVPPYSYYWYLNGKLIGTGNSSVREDLKIGTYNLTMKVEDAAGYSKIAYLIIKTGYNWQGLALVVVLAAALVLILIKAAKPKNALESD